MSAPTTRLAFKDYCLRKLGHPVIEINVASDQIEDRIDSALQMFQLFHMDAVERVFVAHTVTATDLTNGYLTLETPVISVTRIIFGAGLGSENFATDIWQYQYDVFYELGFSKSSTTGMSDYYVRMSNLGLIEDIIANYPTVHHSMHGNKIFMDDDWSNVTEGSTIIYEAYMALDPLTYTSIWNDMWLKKYATALIGVQWGANLQKFQEVQLPGGIVLNGDAIYNQYHEEMIRLEEELRSTYEYPVDFMIG